MLTKFIVSLAASVLLTGAAAADTIKLGLTGPFSGPSARVGYALRDGVRLAVSEINQAGGIMGQQVTLVERDDQSKVERGVQIAHEMIEQQHVVATVGFVNTDVALASEQIYQAAEVPVMNDVASGTGIASQFAPPAQKANYIFQMAANDAVQAALIVKEAISRRGFKAPAIMVDDAEYGQNGRTEFRKALDALGVKPAAEEMFNVGFTDMSDQLSRVQRAHADVILAFGRAKELVGLVNSMAVLGWKLPVIGNWPLSTAAFIVDAGFNADGVSMPVSYIQVGNTPTRAHFVATYQRVYKMPRLISADCAAQGYDSVYLLKAAIEQAESTKGPKIRAALEDLDDKVDGVVTVYDHPFTRADHEAISASIPIFGEIHNLHLGPAHEIDIEGDRVIRVKH